MVLIKNSFKNIKFYYIYDMSERNYFILTVKNDSIINIEGVVMNLYFSTIENAFNP